MTIRRSRRDPYEYGYTCGYARLTTVADANYRTPDDWIAFGRGVLAGAAARRADEAKAREAA